MPVPPQQPVVPSMAMDLSEMDEDSSHWQMYGGTGTAMGSEARHHAVPGHMNESTAYQTWGWQ